VWCGRVKREAEQQSGRATRGNKAPRHSRESSSSHPLATVTVAAAAAASEDGSSGSGMEAGAYTRSVHLSCTAGVLCGAAQHQLFTCLGTPPGAATASAWSHRWWSVPSVHQGVVDWCVGVRH
jgi:hypothetical protein